MEDAAPGCTCACFSSPSRALEQARTEPFDAAFLDIEMGGANGLALAKQLKDLQPDLHIIFVTGYEKYAVSAFAIHASGYLLKPVDSGDLKRELTFLYGDTPASRPIQVHTFGGFEVCVNGKPLVFNRAKSKELLACLIDRRRCRADNLGRLAASCGRTVFTISHAKTISRPLYMTCAIHSARPASLPSWSSTATVFPSAPT